MCFSQALEPLLNELLSAGGRASPNQRVRLVTRLRNSFEDIRRVDDGDSLSRVIRQLCPQPSHKVAYAFAPSASGKRENCPTTCIRRIDLAQSLDEWQVNPDSLGELRAYPAAGKRHGRKHLNPR